MGMSSMMGGDQGSGAAQQNLAELQAKYPWVKFPEQPGGQPQQSPFASMGGSLMQRLMHPQMPGMMPQSQMPPSSAPPPQEGAMPPQQNPLQQQNPVSLQAVLAALKGGGQT